MPRLSLTHNGLAVDDSYAFTEDSQALSLGAADGINTVGLQPIPVSSPYAGKFSSGPVLPEITAELEEAMPRLSLTHNGLAVDGSYASTEDHVQSPKQYNSKPMAPLFDQLYAVGDSMSDSGGIYQLSSDALSLIAAAHINTDGLQPIPFSPPYFSDLPVYLPRFSNGPVLPEITANLLGAKLINFSFGGAEALGTQTLLDVAGSVYTPQALAPVLAGIAALPPEQSAPIEAVLNHNINLSGQMADLVAETSAHPPSAHSALVSLIGLNDLQALEATFDPANPLALIGKAAQVAAGIVQADLGVAHTAFNQGIGTVIFETLPAPNFFPAGQELPPVLQAIGDAAVDAINLGLKVDAFELRLEGHDARIVDLAKITGEISADPAAFGFQNLNQPTLVPMPSTNGIELTELVPNPAAPPPDQTAFFDPLHPTTKLAAVLAQFAAASLTSQSHFVGGGNDFVTGNQQLLAGTDLGQLVASLPFGPRSA